MKLLLTSTGLTHPEITNTFLELLDKTPSESKVGFVPVAAVTEDEKLYVEESKIELSKLGIKEIIDINFKEKDQNICPSLDALYVCGGNTFHLMNEINKSNFAEVIKQFINSDKLFLGVSAGTIIVTPSIGIAAVEPADKNDVGLTNFSGLGIVDFEISPHVPEIVPYENVEKYALSIKNKIYAISDMTAIKIQGDNLEVIGEKNFKIFNNSIFK